MIFKCVYPVALFSRQTSEPIESSVPLWGTQTGNSSETTVLSLQEIKDDAFYFLPSYCAQFIIVCYAQIYLSLVLPLFPSVQAFLWLHQSRDDPKPQKTWFFIINLFIQNDQINNNNNNKTQTYPSTRLSRRAYGSQWTTRTLKTHTQVSQQLYPVFKYHQIAEDCG